MSLRAALAVVTLALALSVGAAIPENDHFAARIALFGVHPITTGNNVGATKEPGEPDPGFVGGNSVWWTWTAPANGRLTVTTAGSNFDTILTVGSGNSLSNLTVLGFNDNDTNACTVKLNVIAGTAYQIAVDGAGGAMGNITLTLTLGPTQTPPSNNNFANRIPLAGTHLANVTGSNAGATAEPGEPFHVDSVGFRSVWWTWTAPGSGGLTLTTQNSAIDTVLAVYTGSSLTNLVFVAGNDEDPLSAGYVSRVTCNVTAGTAYQIAIDGYEGDEGDVRLRLDLDSAFVAPTNDNFSNRATLTGANATANGSNVNASFESLDANFEMGEPLHLYTYGGRSVWYTWTAPASGGVTLFTTNVSVDTVLVVYTGNSLTNLSFVAGNDENYLTVADLDSRLSFNATSGTTYQIAVDGFDSDSGAFTLRLLLGPSEPVPANNDFDNRTLVTGNNTTVSGSNIGATLEPDEPAHDDSYGGKSVWWRWVSPGPGIVTIDTIGSICDTMLGIYSGSALSNLVEIASDDESGGNYTSKVTFYTKGAITYQIAVDGYDGDSGPISLHVLFTSASYTLTLNTNPLVGGWASFDPQPDQNGKYAPGSVVTLSAGPTNSYVFTNWSGGHLATNNPAVTAMTSNKTITANFFLPPPRLTPFQPQSQPGIQANGFRFFLSGPTNYTYAIERSENLTNWASFATNVLSAESLELLDPTAGTNASRYYRARRLP